ncbi:MAG: YwbE family protein, partial [Spirochaetaceae bacterium]
MDTKKSGTEKDGRRRGDIKPGRHVSIVLKRDQQTGALTEGIVERILTNSPNHLYWSEPW